MKRPVIESRQLQCLWGSAGLARISLGHCPVHQAYRDGKPVQVDRDGLFAKAIKSAIHSAVFRVGYCRAPPESHLVTGLAYPRLTSPTRSW